MALPEVHLLAGTRPEAIKLAPVVAQLRRRGRMRPVLVASGQHSAMVGQALAAFDLAPDAALPAHRRTGGQAELLGEMVTRIDAHLAAHRPAAMLVQGDTTTTLAGALAAFWRQVPVVHLEAGLRTGDLAAPFPEEGNRRLVAQVAALHLAPTAESASNLLGEGTPANKVLLTGNTVVDATMQVLERHGETALDDPRLRQAASGRMIVLTAHRRESWGAPLDRILSALRSLLAAYPDVWAVVPAHPNPDVRRQVDDGLSGVARAVVTGPLPYATLVSLLARCYLALTDSGGIQEEAPTFGVPVLVLREVTERIESLRAGCARLVGTDPAVIVAETAALLDDPARRAAMVAAGNPYGDGRAAQRVEQAIASLLGLAPPPDPMPVLVDAAVEDPAVGVPDAADGAPVSGGPAGAGGSGGQAPDMAPASGGPAGAALSGGDDG